MFVAHCRTSLTRVHVSSAEIIALQRNSHVEVEELYESMSNNGITVAGTDTVSACSHRLVVIRHGNVPFETCFPKHSRSMIAEHNVAKEHNRLYTEMFLALNELHAMQTYGGAEVQLHTFLTSAIDNTSGWLRVWLLYIRGKNFGSQCIGGGVGPTVIRPVY
jgi:hypothetical protein